MAASPGMAVAELLESRALALEGLRERVDGEAERLAGLDEEVEAARAAIASERARTLQLSRHSGARNATLEAVRRFQRQVRKDEAILEHLNRTAAHAGAHCAAGRERINHLRRDICTFRAISEKVSRQWLLVHLQLCTRAPAALRSVSGPGSWLFSHDLAPQQLSPAMAVAPTAAPLRPLTPACNSSSHFLVWPSSSHTCS